MRRGEHLVLTAATDGNHGRAVAWTARQLGQESVIFVPEDMKPCRRRAIEAEGAQVRIVEGVYDRAVREAQRHGRQPGWVTVSDTAGREADPVPEWITRGHRTLFSESARQLAALGAFPPAVLVLQAGVGAFARAAVDFHGPAGRPRLVIIEALRAAGLFESASSRDGGRHSARGDIRSLMAGLNCAWPSRAAWPALRQRVDLFVAIGDGWAEQAVRRLYRPLGEDPAVVAGESGAAGLAGLLALASLPEVRRELPLDASSSVLVVNTEGDTDPESFQRLVGE